MEKEQIIEKIRKESSFLKEKYHVKEVALFGSVLRNEHHKDSDIDLIVEFNSPIGFFDFIRLESFLSELLDKKVDLISKKALKPVIKEEILKQAVYV